MCKVDYNFMGREAAGWEKKYFFREVGRGGNPDSAFMLLLASRRGRAGGPLESLGAELFGRLVGRYALAHLTDDPRTVVRKLVEIVSAEAAAATAAKTELAAGFVHVKGTRAVAGSVGRLRAGLADRDTLVTTSPLPAGLRKRVGAGQVALDLGYTVEGDLTDTPAFFIAPSSALAMGDEPLQRFLWEFASGRSGRADRAPASWEHLPCVVGVSLGAAIGHPVDRRGKRSARGRSSRERSTAPGEKIGPASVAGARTSRGKRGGRFFGGIEARAVRSALLVGLVAVAAFFTIRLILGGASPSGPPEAGEAPGSVSEVALSGRGGEPHDTEARVGIGGGTEGKRETAGVEAAVEESSSPSPAALRPLWLADLGGTLTSSPADLGGAIVFGSRDRHVYCLSKADGNVIWRFDGPDGFGSSPAAADGRVFIGCYDGGVFCLRADDGSRIWRYGTRGRVVSSPALTAGGDIVVGSYDGYVYCLTPEGELRWRYNCGARVWSSPVCSGGLVIFGDVAGRIHCLDSATGRAKWSAKAGGAIYGAPAAAGGHVYFGSSDGTLAALETAGGKTLWRFKGPAAVSSSIGAVAGDLVVGYKNGALSRISSDEGTRLWTIVLPGPVRSRPVECDGAVTVTCYDGRVYLIDAASGSVLSRSDVIDEIYCTPLVSSGAAYFGDMKGVFAAFDLVTSSTQ